MSGTGPSLMPSRATIRWYERHVKRYYEPELGDRKKLDHNMELNVEQAIQIPDDPSNEPNLLLHHRLVVETDDASAVLDAAVSFIFPAGTELTEDSAGQFIEVEGHSYVLGMIRGALADAFRSVGLAAVLVPVLPYSAVAEAGPKLDEPEESDTGSYDPFD